MLPHRDSSQLRQTVWNEDEGEQSISCGELTEEERDEAVVRYRDNGYASIDISPFTPSASNQLRDPYLLAIMADVVHEGLPPSPSAEVYQRAFEYKLQKRGSFVDIATIKDIVGSIAIKCLTSQPDRFREIDVAPANMRGEIIRLMKDLRVFIDAGDGFLQFDHDRTFEYFIAVGLGPVVARRRGGHASTWRNAGRSDRAIARPRFRDLRLQFVLSRVRRRSPPAAAFQPCAS
jgi:hypothetical protein